VGSGPLYVSRLAFGAVRRAQRAAVTALGVFAPNRVSLVLAPLWLLALPFIGALGAWFSLRAGGSGRDRLLAALGSAWLMGSILTLGVPLSMVIEEDVSLRVKLTAYIV
jgi:hypothetical protein